MYLGTDQERVGDILAVATESRVIPMSVEADDAEQSWNYKPISYASATDLQDDRSIIAIVS